MRHSQPILLHNTLTQKKDTFEPLHDKSVRLYSCGPTVYSTQHIGNLSNIVFTDILRRTLEYNTYAVKHVMNITDFGHLTSDADEGEDKMSIGLQHEGLELTLANMKNLAERHESQFIKDSEQLNAVEPGMLFPRASDYIDEQIALIKTLQEKGYAYETTNGIYFDVARFPTYGALGGQSATLQIDGARVTTDSEKHDPRDFVLWKKDDALGWQSPWGMGFPGWHIECSAMVRGTLGRQIDIHTGGIEHIGVHHNNEIAQSEAATGRAPLSRFWMHRAHIQIEGKKISKSLGNTIYLRHIIDRGYSPLSYRYWLLTAHYRTPANFTWDALAGAHTAHTKLLSFFVDKLLVSLGTVDAHYEEQFHTFINDDLDTPKALALTWTLVKDSSISYEDKRATLLRFDTVLGLGLSEIETAHTALLGKKSHKVTLATLPQDIQDLVDAREAAREADDFGQADDARIKLKEAGYTVTDTGDGPVVNTLTT